MQILVRLMLDQLHQIITDITNANVKFIVLIVNAS